MTVAVAGASHRSGPNLDWKPIVALDVGHSIVTRKAAAVSSQSRVYCRRSRRS